MCSVLADSGSLPCKKHRQTQTAAQPRFIELNRGATLSSIQPAGFAEEEKERATPYTTRERVAGADPEQEHEKEKEREKEREEEEE